MGDNRMNSDELFKKARKAKAREIIGAIDKQLPILDNMRKDAQKLVKNKIPVEDEYIVKYEEQTLRHIKARQDDLLKTRKHLFKEELGLDGE